MPPVDIGVRLGLVRPALAGVRRAVACYNARRLRSREDLQTPLALAMAGSPVRAVGRALDLSVGGAGAWSAARALHEGAGEAQGRQGPANPPNKKMPTRRLVIHFTALYDREGHMPKYTSATSPQVVPRLPITPQRPPRTARAIV